MMRSEEVKRAREEANDMSAVEAERSLKLFCLNLEQYTCYMRDETIVRFVSERVSKNDYPS